MTGARMVASFAGVGLSPVAPGTAGSLAALVPGAVLLWASPVALGLAAVLATVAGLWSVAAAKVTGDPQWVVIDEVAGQWIALLALPHPSFAGCAAAFVAFRALDIAKPGPIGWAERAPGAVGIMADDVLAGIVAAALVAGVRWAVPGLLD
jgi:phosphatidylglycerophosphatase A